MMLISPYASTFLKIKISNPLGSAKVLKKSSKTKQRFYIKFLKTKTLEDESKYKNYKSLFEKLRKKAKKACYSKLLYKYETDSKRTW